MKYIFIAAAFIFSVQATAQKSDVIADSTKTKAAIFAKTLSWIGKTWGDPDKVVDTKDDVTGTILVKGGLKAVPKADGFGVKGASQTELKIVIENGRARLNFSHTIFKWDAGTVWNFEDDNGGAQKAKWKADVLNELEEMVASYKADFK